MGWLPTLTELSPFGDTVVRPQSHTRAGGLLAVTLLPALVLLYSLWWFNDFFATRAGVREVSHLVPLDADNGFAALDGSDEHNQTLICLAASGCWYNVRVNEAGEPDGCPSTADQAYQRGVQQSLVSDLASMPAAAMQHAVPQRCHHVARLEVLRHACLVHTPDPRSSLSIVWKADASEPASAFGVALYTFAVDEPNLQGCRSSFLSSECPRRAAGAGISPRLAPVMLHYGEVALQIIKRRLEYMQPKDSTQLVPQYANTDPANPDSTNACYATSNDADGGGVCTGSRCRQLKVRPSPMLLKERSWVTPPFATYLGVLGGAIGLVMLLLGHLHGLLLRCVGGRGVFAPVVTVGNREAAALLLHAVQEGGSGLAAFSALSHAQRMDDPEPRSSECSAPMAASTKSSGPRKVRGGGLKV